VSLYIFVDIWLYPTHIRLYLKINDKSAKCPKRMSAKNVRKKQKVRKNCPQIFINSINFPYHHNFYYLQLN